MAAPLVVGSSEQEKVVLSIDQQQVSTKCSDCGTEYQVIRGSVYHESTPFALYLVALHAHPETAGSVVHLAVAVRAANGSKEAVSLVIVGDRERIGFNFADWSGSPWRGEHYLGTMLGREAALASTLKPTFLQIAERVVRDLPAVEEYLASGRDN